MASIRKLRGKYYVRIRFQSKEKLIPTHTKIKRDAEIILRKYQQNEQEVKLGLAESLIERNLTLKDCINYFMQNYQVERGITDSTISSYKLALNDLLDCFLYIKRMRELTKQHYPILVEYLKRRYNPTTVNIRLRGIRTFLNYIEDKEVIRKKPFKVGQVKIDKHPPKLLTPQELDSIYAQVHDPKLMATFKTLEVTGMRVGEIKNSRRDGGYIIIYKSKGRKERFVPIKEEHISDYELAKETGYGNSWISHSFSRFVKRCKIKEKKTLHSLRHTYAYRKLIEMDNIQLVRDLLGHSSVVVTEIYTQIPQDYLKQIYENKAVERDTDWIQA